MTRWVKSIPISYPVVRLEIGRDSLLPHLTPHLLGPRHHGSRGAVPPVMLRVAFQIWEGRFFLD
jgi:hypothetical protein